MIYSPHSASVLVVSFQSMHTNITMYKGCSFRHKLVHQGKDLSQSRGNIYLKTREGSLSNQRKDLHISKQREGSFSKQGKDLSQTANTHLISLIFPHHDLVIPDICHFFLHEHYFWLFFLHTKARKSQKTILR